MNEKTDSSIMQNKRAQADSGMTERITKIVLVITALLIVFITARAFMFYQTGMEDKGEVRHFYLENKLFLENPKFSWSPFANDYKITFTKTDNKLTIGKEVELNYLSCQTFDTSSISKKVIIDPFYGTSSGKSAFIDGVNVMESKINQDVANGLKQRIPDSVLTKTSDSEEKMNGQRVDLINTENPGIYVGLRMSSDFEGENVIRVYISSRGDKSMSQFLGCSILNSFLAEGQSSVSGVSILMIDKDDQDEKLLTTGRPSVIVEFSNFKDKNAIKFSQTDTPAVALQKGIENFYKGKAGIDYSELSFTSSNIVAVPEPGVLGLGAMGGVLVLRRRRRGV